MELSLAQRDAFVELLRHTYVIPEQYRDAVATAIRKYSTRNYTDETIARLITVPQSLFDSLYLVRSSGVDSSEGPLARGSRDWAQFRGKLFEWLVCAEYNALRNRGQVLLSIVNPDPTSKADILHIIKVGNSIKVVAGPDVKTGSAAYLLKEWEDKILKTRYEIPLIDPEGIISGDGVARLSSAQRAKLERLSAEYPNKRPLPSVWSMNSMQTLRVMQDFIKFVLYDKSPSERPPAFGTNSTEALRQQINSRIGPCRSRAVCQSWSDFSVLAIQTMAWPMTDPANPRTTVSGVLQKTVANPSASSSGQAVEKQDNAAKTDVPASATVGSTSNKRSAIPWLFDYGTRALRWWSNLDPVTRSVMQGAAKGLWNVSVEAITSRGHERPISLTQASSATSIPVDSGNRVSPREHTVGPHTQTYHTNAGPEVRSKGPYTRGGSSE